MTFGRWLLIHSLSISILVMLGVGYFYKEELKLKQAYNQLLLIDPDKISVSKNSIYPNKIETEQVSSNSVNSKVNKKEQKTRAENIAKKKPLRTTVTLKRALPKKVSEPSSSLASIKKDTTDSKVVESKIDYLLQAREAFWDKNYQRSIELYTNEINKMPESADLYGELGNIYYSLNNYEVASVNYLKAGELFIKTGEEGRAKQVYDILISIAPQKAQMLLNLKNQQHQ